MADCQLSIADSFSDRRLGHGRNLIGALLHSAIAQ
jgi:hypothetical protein